MKPHLVTPKQVAIAKGLVSYLPFAMRFWGPTRANTASVDYCYRIWLHHLCALHAHGLPTEFETVAELGPGHTIGTGLAALLSSAHRYMGLEARLYPHNAGLELGVLEALIHRFQQRRGCDSHDLPFPDHILTPDRMSRWLAPDRLDALRAVLRAGYRFEAELPARPIQYVVPWNLEARVRPESVDVVFSQSVLEHIDDLETTYAALWRWLKPGGVMSHSIDFRCHGFSKTWDGHREYGALTWRLMRGRRPFLLNRTPYSEHLRLIEKTGFRCVGARRVSSPALIPRERLAPEFQNLSSDDLAIQGALILATKPS